MKEIEKLALWGCVAFTLWALYKHFTRKPKQVATTVPVNANVVNGTGPALR